MSFDSKDYHEIYMENMQQKETIENLQHQLTKICKYESHQNAPNFEKMKTKETTTAKKMILKIGLLVFAISFIGMAFFTAYAFVQLKKVSEKNDNFVISQPNEAKNKNAIQGIVQAHSARKDDDDEEDDFKLKLKPLQKYFFNVGMRNDYRLQECQGSQFKQTFPDVDYAFFGYNILKGYPLSVGHDPGFTYPIFDADYSKGKQSADCRYSVPEGLVVVPDVSCVTSFSSTTVQNKYEFAKSLSVSASVSGGGWGVSFSASAGYKESSSQMSTGESVFIISTAKCTYYFSKFVIEKPPRFSEAFLSWVNRLKRTDAREIYFDFFETYGTHFPTYTTFGSRFTYEHKMSSKSFQSKREKGVNVAVQASYSGLFSVGGGFNMDSSQQEAASDFSKSVETKTITVGAPPPANGDAMTWASTVKDSPVPMEYKLQSIENLFTEYYMKHMKIDYEKIAENIKRFKSDYCKYLRDLGEIDSCDDLTPGIMLARTRLFDHFKSRAISNFGECIDLCLQNINCEAVTFCKTCSEYERTCYMYKNINGHTVGGTGSDDWKSAVFPSKINDILKFQNTNIIGVPRSSDSKTETVTTQTECTNICINDAHCVAYTFCTCPDDKIKCHLYAGNRINEMVNKPGSTAYFISYRAEEPDADMTQNTNSTIASASKEMPRPTSTSPSTLK